MLKRLTAPIYSRFFVYIFLLNIISNISSLVYLKGILVVIVFIALSSLAAYIEAAICLLIRNNICKRIYQGVVILFHTILAVIEYFLIINFQRVISQSIIDILGETNPQESSEFLSTYLSPLSIFAYIIATIIGSYLLYKSSGFIYKKTKYSYIAIPFVILGLLLTSYCAYGFVVYRDGKGIPQMTSITRGSYALFIMHKNQQQIDKVTIACRELKVTQTSQKKPTIVVIIGESHSLQHSSLYGYSKCTNPLLGKLMQEGSLIKYDNATCVETFTIASLRADYSLDSLGVDYENTALFPACFKNAGYHTELYDNQYFVGQRVNFMSDEELSKTLFDKRNSKMYKYDGDMVKDITVKDTPSLYIIHLWGQHYKYQNRYPESFDKFQPSQYNQKYSERQRTRMALYDNACLYNDYVVNSIIDKFKKQTYCCIFYFSDHGEEVFELRNYMGHGNGETSPDIRYQINVPLLVWMSEDYKKDYGSKFLKAIHYPISLDDIGHTIIDAAGLRCKDFLERRSFISDRYNINRQRIVMHSVDYDKTVQNQKHIVFE